jgi:hypothetical protein
VRERARAATVILAIVHDRSRRWPPRGKRELGDDEGRNDGSAWSAGATTTSAVMRTHCLIRRHHPGASEYRGE